MLLLMWVKMFVANSFELKPIMPRSGRRLMCQVGPMFLSAQVFFLNIFNLW